MTYLNYINFPKKYLFIIFVLLVELNLLGSFPVYAAEVVDNNIAPVINNYLLPMTIMDYPEDNTVSKGNNLIVSGWALNNSGIEEIRLIVNGIYFGSAQIDISRPDVGRTYPEYPDGGTSGYYYLLDTSIIPPGSNQITVEAVGNDGSISSTTKTVSIEKEPARFSIDSPVNGYISTAVETSIRGWALNASGIKEIQMYVNGKFDGKAVIGINRPDVNVIYPGYPQGDKSGYTYQLKTSALGAGDNTITIKVIGNDGSTSSYNTRVVRKASRLSVDFPLVNSVNKGNFITVSGWALNATGIADVRVLVNEKYVGSAITGLSRPDVDNAYPGYQDGKTSGYQYQIDTGLLPAGRHQITVEAVGKDGGISRDTINVFIEKAPPKFSVDSPENGHISVSEESTIRGWALNASGVKEIEIYVNGKIDGKAITGLSRPDVAWAYPGYPQGDKSGYSYQLKTSSLTTGDNVITIKVIGNDGSISSYDTRIIRKTSRLSIDFPEGNSVNKGNNLTISGWALNPTGIADVRVSVNGEYIGSAIIGLSRPDVDRVYPGYVGGSTSGYQYLLETVLIPPGSHQINVEAVGKDGSISSTTRNVIIEKAPARFSIDSPDYGHSTISEQTTIRGWALNASGVNKIEVYVNGKFDGNAIIGLNRPDVGTVYPGYIMGHKSGFEYNVNRSVLYSGINSINFKSIGYDGTIQEFYFSLYTPEIMGQKTFYNSTIDEALAIQLKYNPQTDIYTGKWAAAKPEDVKYYLNPLNFVSDDIINSSPNIKKIQITTKSLNVRSGPDTSYQIVTTAAQGEIYNIIATEENWIKIQKNDIVGWISNFYVSYISEQINIPKYDANLLQFLKLSGQTNIDRYILNKELVNKGVLEGKADAFITASSKNNISSIYLMVHSLLETGNGTSNLARGVLVSSVNGEPVTPKITYNMFGIGAVDGDAEKQGSEYAYKMGWFSVEEAILGGSEWIASRYINNKEYMQDTLYKMRWNPNNPGLHQYATDIGWAFKQSNMMDRIADILIRNKIPMIMDIPVYK